MATASFKSKMAHLSRDEVIEECFEAMKRLRQVKQELADEREEMGRLKTAVEEMTAREVHFQKEIDWLTCRPLLCSVVTANSQAENDDEVIDEPIEREVIAQFEKVQGHIRKRWLDDATMRIKKETQEGGPRQPLFNEEMRTAAQKWVVEAANVRRDLFPYNNHWPQWRFVYCADLTMFLFFCTDAKGVKKVYPWLFDFGLLYGQ